MTSEVNIIKTDSCSHNERATVPQADIFETENEYVIKADMPGVKKEDVDITLDGSILYVNGKITEDDSSAYLRYREYSLYNYSRSFSVGSDVNGSGIKDSAADGVLTVTLPKKEEIKPRKIQITSN